MNGEIAGGRRTEAERFWEGHYRRHERRWNGTANAVLADVVGVKRSG